MKTKDAMTILTRWVLLVEEFDLEVKDLKGTGNQVVDHFSHLEEEAMLKLGDELEINDTFSNDHVLATSQELITWFVDFANYLTSDPILEDMSFQQYKLFMHEVRRFFWYDPYLFQVYANGAI